MKPLHATALRLHTTIRLLSRRAHTVAGTDAPSRSEQGVMAWLDEKGALTPGALAALEKVRPQTMGQTLDALDRHAWIKRSPHPTDRRQTLISLTPAGRKTLLRVRALMQTWFVQEIQKLSPDDFKKITGALDILEQVAQSWVQLHQARNLPQSATSPSPTAKSVNLRGSRRASAV